MSLKRKLVAAGLPAAGATLFALAFAGPASAAPAHVLAAPAALPVEAMVDCGDAVAELPLGIDCDDDAGATADDDMPTRGNAGYGYGDDTGGDTGSGTGDGDEGPIRGDDGYGGVDEVPTPGTPATPGTDTPGVSPDELPIPGRDFGFRRLIQAQAAGDLASLEERGRRIVRIRLEDV